MKADHDVTDITESQTIHNSLTSLPFFKTLCLEFFITTLGISSISKFQSRNCDKSGSV